MTANTAELNVYKIALVDLGAILAIYFLPSVSHLLPFPMYFAEPMRIITIAVYFLSKNHKNSLLIALTLPLFSMMFSGHPIPLKASLISIELLMNVFMLDIFIRYFKWKVFIALSVSILASKVVYYFLKYMIIQFGFLQGSLVSIPLYIQLISLIITSLVFFVFLYPKNRKEKS